MYSYRPWLKTESSSSRPSSKSHSNIFSDFNYALIFLCELSCLKKRYVCDSYNRKKCLNWTNITLSHDVRNWVFPYIVNINFNGGIAKKVVIVWARCCIGLYRTGCSKKTVAFQYWIFLISCGKRVITGI